MSCCLEFFCCCFYPSNTPNNSTRVNTSRSHSIKKKQRTKKSRIITKFAPEEIAKVTKQQKRAGKTAYACPICFQLYNKILACEECSNNICYECLLDYEKKYSQTEQNMKCPFCLSDKCNFVDYEKEAHSYFDTTDNGFLGASIRKKIDEEIVNNNNEQSMQRLDSQVEQNEQQPQIQRLDVIQEQSRNADIIISNRNIENVDQYHEIMVSHPQIESLNVINEPQSRYLDRDQDNQSIRTNENKSQEKAEGQVLNDSRQISAQISRKQSSILVVNQQQKEEKPNKEQQKSEQQGNQQQKEPTNIRKELFIDLKNQYQAPSHTQQKESNNNSMVIQIQQV